MKIKELAKALAENKTQLLDAQKNYESTLDAKVANRVCRNKRTHGGWTVPGNHKWTRAVKAARLPWDNFWSGSNPTPSTQYPQAIADYLRSIDNHN